ncbi:phosphonatase-like hydrolase [Niabella drilacis]|uniref:Phosphonatase-like hydrolase n=1 Tax=Niabella drilacis (strain DSM 25811 / CCM 8410 / CCUG 62505 / LMG 26954 / E90) TaxID=1285928 RepID=A0A1G6V6X7_NIADE|nr:phosphonatase-like hydrolase [Niabella drilacis]SDD49430.1 phosphonatase-like hydrolase [Niabella drilacis]
MKKIKMVVFDMAGTTVNENNLVYKTVLKVINDQGFDLTLEDVLAYGAGKEKYQAITDVLTACTDVPDVKPVADQAFAKFKQALEKAYDEETISSFSGMDAFFERLREHHILIALNTGYDKRTALKLISKLDWQAGRNFDTLVAADDVEKGRPFPDMIRYAMKQLDVSDAGTVLKAGDSAIDIEEGKNAGCGITVGVLSGAQTREQLSGAKPDYIINNLTELDAILFN